MGWPAIQLGSYSPLRWTPTNPISFLTRQTNWVGLRDVLRTSASPQQSCPVFRVYQGTCLRQGFVRGKHSGVAACGLRKNLPM